jgi:adenosylhomocysteine nucleosidase
MHPWDWKALSMHIAVLAAMPIELRPFVRSAGLQPSGEDYTGSVAGHDITAAKMGVGMTGATRTTERLLRAGDVDRVVVIGICGGLDESIPIGSVLSPEVLVDGATGTEYRPAAWDPIELRGTLVTFDDFELELQMIPKLAADGASAVDMETAAVAAVCEQHGCPYAVFRSISDYAMDGTVDAAIGAMAKPDGSSDRGAALRYMVRRPWRIPGLLRLGRGAQAAAKAASDAALTAIRA